MAFKLKGKEEKFFSILENHAALTYESAEMMERVFKGEISKEEAFLEIDTKEKAADELVTETVERLRKTFITLCVYSICIVQLCESFIIYRYAIKYQQKILS